MMKQDTITALRMERQFLTRPAEENEYDALYRDTQPGQNVYWNGFGQPPTLTFRTEFDDKAYNAERQLRRVLVKGRFQGGNLGWIGREDMELFACAFRKPLGKPTAEQLAILELIEREGPLTIQQIKEITGLLVRQITPVLHRLQEAFLIYEDQYDGAWDRGWYPFAEAFPETDLNKYTRREALEILLPRFAYRHVVFDVKMAKSFYRLPEKDLRAAVSSLCAGGVLCETEGGYMRTEDALYLETYEPVPLHFIRAMHRNDFLVKSNEHVLKERFRPLCENLPYDHEPLQYLLVDGEFRGAVVGHFRNGPYDLNDVVLDAPELAARRAEILSAVRGVNFGDTPARFMGEA
ncbi:MAG: hypothetical protein ACI4GO_09170, partial [Hominenteromicrobium sp.]